MQTLSLQSVFPARGSIYEREVFKHTVEIINYYFIVQL